MTRDEAEKKLPESKPTLTKESERRFERLSQESKKAVLDDLKAWMEQGQMNPILKPSFLGIDPHSFVYSDHKVEGIRLSEFCSIARNLLDCFATAVISAPGMEFPASALTVRCRLGEGGNDLVLYLTAILTTAEQISALELTEESEIWISSNLRPLAKTKQIELGNIFWERTGRHSFFFFGYPGQMVRDTVHGVGAPGEDGKLRWPECTLLLGLVTATLRETAVRAIDFVNSTPESPIQ